MERGEYEDVKHFLEQVEALAEPSATRIVREATGQLTTRDADDKTTYLPSSMSKRGVYRQYCHERGKKVVTAHTGQVTLEDIPDTEVFECISWSAFINFWKKASSRKN